MTADVSQVAGQASRLIHEARDLKLPVEPGVRTSETPSSAGPFFSKG